IGAAGGNRGEGRTFAETAESVSARPCGGDARDDRAAELSGGLCRDARDRDDPAGLARSADVAVIQNWHEAAHSGRSTTTQNAASQPIVAAVRRWRTTVNGLTSSRYSRILGKDLQVL